MIRDNWLSLDPLLLLSVDGWQAGGHVMGGGGGFGGGGHRMRRFEARQKVSFGWFVATAGSTPQRGCRCCVGLRQIRCCWHRHGSSSVRAGAHAAVSAKEGKRERNGEFNNKERKKRYKWPWEHKRHLALNCAWRDNRAFVRQGCDLAYVYCNWHSSTWTNVFIIPLCSIWQKCTSAWTHNISLSNRLQIPSLAGCLLLLLLPPSFETPCR